MNPGHTGPAQAYLAEGDASGRYYGASDYDDRQVLGSRGGAGGRFCKERRLWYAGSREVCLAMLQTGKWTPVGADARAVATILGKQLQAEQDAADAAWAAQVQRAQSVKVVLTEAKRLDSTQGSGRQGGRAGARNLACGPGHFQRDHCSVGEMGRASRAAAFRRGAA